MIAHLPVIFANRDAGINGRFPRRHRHRGRIADNHRPIHQRAAGFRVFHFRVFGNCFDDFARPLAASDNHHDVNRRIAGNQALQHGFARAERPRNAARAAPRNREKRVNNSQRRRQRLAWIEPLRLPPPNQSFGKRAAHRPILKQRDDPLFPFFILNAGNRLVHGHAAAPNPRHVQRAGFIERRHDFMRERAFLHRAERLPRHHAIPCVDKRGKIPRFRLI